MSVTEGLFVCIVGPSGVGKDTLLRMVKKELADDGRFLFPPRCVTRPRSVHEDHLVLSQADYAAGLAKGRFAIAWRAHGFGYAIESDILPALSSGRIVISNLSREAVTAARRAFPSVITILIVAPQEMLIDRLAGRGRESGEDIDERLGRNREFADFASDFTVDNSGPLGAAAQRLASILRGLEATLRQQKSPQFQ